MDVCLDIYNHVLRLRKRYYSMYHKSVSITRMQAEFAKLKKHCYEEWWEISSASAQQIVERIYEGYQLFFEKHSKRTPKFKNERTYRSITFKDSGWELENNVFIINKSDLRLRFSKSRDFDKNDVQTVTLKRDNCGDWWLTFVIRKDVSGLFYTLKTGKTAGGDFGLKHFLTLDNGVIIEMAQFLKGSLNKIRKKSRNLSKKVKGSNNRAKAKKELAKLYRELTNKRTDMHWKIAINLAREYDIIFIEDLNIKEMQKRWGRKINDLGFTEFVLILDWVCKKYGKQLVKISRWEATSKTCSVCGYKMAEMPLKLREWDCPNCGTHHDRDINAAKNIKKAGANAIAGENGRRMLELDDQ